MKKNIKRTKKKQRRWGLAARLERKGRKKKQ